MRGTYSNLAKRLVCRSVEVDSVATQSTHQAVCSRRSVIAQFRIKVVTPCVEDSDSSVSSLDARFPPNIGIWNNPRAMSNVHRD